MAEEALRLWGRIDILVNNAGITHLPKPMEEVTEEEFDRVMAVNVKSVYLTARHLVPAMKAAGRGAILNVASTAGLSPRPRLNWYNASKGWMITATKTMAVELAPAGVRVNALAPVAGETPLLKSFLGRGHARDAGEVPLHHPDRAVLDAGGHGERGALSLFGRGVDGDRRGADRGRRALHLRGERGALPLALPGVFVPR
jgi:NAD(P)-dependent dehydrogenase (short-subunit alcohol dehydrogenase family)